MLSKYHRISLTALRDSLFYQTIMSKTVRSKASLLSRYKNRWDRWRESFISCYWLIHCEKMFQFNNSKKHTVLKMKYELCIFRMLSAVSIWHILLAIYSPFLILLLHDNPPAGRTCRCLWMHSPIHPFIMVQSIKPPKRNDPPFVSILLKTISLTIWWNFVQFWISFYFSHFHFSMDMYTCHNIPTFCNLLHFVDFCQSITILKRPVILLSSSCKWTGESLYCDEKTCPSILFHHLDFNFTLSNSNIYCSTIIFFLFSLLAQLKMEWPQSWVYWYKFENKIMKKK